MNFREALMASITASVWLSWIAVLIACLPAFAIGMPSAPRGHRAHFVIAGLLGGIVGEFCAVHSLFFSIYLWCRSFLPEPCNSAQGDMGLIYLLPIGSIIGSMLGLFWMWLTLKIPEESAWTSVFIYAGPSRIRNWCCAIAVPLGFCVLITCLLARMMALSH